MRYLLPLILLATCSSSLSNESTLELLVRPGWGSEDLVRLQADRTLLWRPGGQDGFLACGQVDEGTFEASTRIIRALIRHLSDFKDVSYKDHCKDNRSFELKISAGAFERVSIGFTDDKRCSAGAVVPAELLELVALVQEAVIEMCPAPEDSSGKQ